MVDFVTKEVRSRIMRGIKRTDTMPEIWVRKALHRHGFRFRLHRRDLPGTPDIVLPKLQTVIMVHGCFWHQHENCKIGRIPLSNSGYWKPKLARNHERDLQKQLELEKLGWKVHTIWECEASDREKLDEWVRRVLSQGLDPSPLRRMRMPGSKY